MVTGGGSASAGSPSGLDTLLMLSGGVDSTWCLWQRAKAGLSTRTHHVVLSDHEGRAEVEAEASRQVLGWIGARMGAGVISHTESFVDFGSVRWIPMNYYLWAYWAGVLFAAPAGRSLEKVILPRHSDAFSGGPEGPSARRSDGAYRSIVETISGREPVLEFPMAHLTKAEVVRDLPPELLTLTWHCRRPRSGRPCHKCHTCKQVDAARAG